MSNCTIDRRGLVFGAAAMLLLPQEGQAAIRATSATIEAMTNSVRQRNGRAEFRRSAKLEYAAQKYSKVLALRNQLSHSVDGTTLSTRAQSVGYPFARLAENIGWVERRGDYRDIAGWFLEGWMLSPGHRRNILDARLRHLGVGVTRAGRRFYAVQVFGTER